MSVSEEEEEEEMNRDREEVEQEESEWENEGNCVTRQFSLNSLHLFRSLMAAGAGFSHFHSFPLLREWKSNERNE